MDMDINNRIATAKRRTMEVTKVDRIRNTNTTDSFSPLEQVETKQIGRWGHMPRMSEERLAKGICITKVRKKGRGRTNKMWDDQMVKILRDSERQMHKDVKDSKKVVELLLAPDPRQIAIGME